MSVTIAQIEDAIVTKLTSKLAAARKIAIQKGVEGIPEPAVYVSTEEGEFSKVTMSTWKQSLTIYVDIIFKNLADEKNRREGIYPILQGCVQALFLEKLGLAIEEIKPRSWNNTTTEELSKKGLMALSLVVQTSFTISKLDETAVLDLLSVGLNYYLKPGDEVEDATDLVTLQDV